MEKLIKLLSKGIMKVAEKTANYDGDIIIEPTSVGYIHEPKAPASLLKK